MGEVFWDTMPVVEAVVFFLHDLYPLPDCDGPGHMVGICHCLSFGLFKLFWSDLKQGEWAQRPGPAPQVILGN